jgi:hypothetical protein
MSINPDDGEKVEGMVTARKCGCCGHHELGIVTAENEYVPLRPGMRVVVVEEHCGDQTGA